MMPIRANIVGPARLSDQDQGFHRCLPFCGLVLGFRKLRDVSAGIVERFDAAAASLARFYIDTNEATIREDLVQSRVNLEASLGKILGRTAAVQIAEAFVEAVIKYRRRLRRAK